MFRVFRGVMAIRKNETLSCDRLHALRKCNRLSGLILSQLLLQKCAFSSRNTHALGKLDPVPDDGEAAAFCKAGSRRCFGVCIEPRRVQTFAFHQIRRGGAEEAQGDAFALIGGMHPADPEI